MADLTREEPFLFSLARHANLRQLQINQQQQSLQAAVRGDIFVVSEPRSAQRRQHTLYLHMGVQAVREGTESKADASLWKRHILPGPSLQTQQRHCQTWRCLSALLHADTTLTACHQWRLSLNLNAQSLYLTTHTQRRGHQPRLPVFLWLGTIFAGGPLFFF